LWSIWLSLAVAVAVVVVPVVAEPVVTVQT
jgi:hypothetical protein